MAKEYDLGPVMGPAGPAGPEGPQGGIGPQGPAGTAATVRVGAVATGEPGTAATVENAGTETAAVLNFSIPKGLKGDKGDKGEPGATGPQGPAGADGATGPAGPQGPKGDKGDTGAVGPQGPAGAQGPKGDIGPAGPKGATGATGATGPQGTPTTVNGKTGASITLTAADVGAAASGHTHTAAQVGAAASSHTHSAADLSSGTLNSARLPTVPLNKGGTGATTASAARTALGACALVGPVSVSINTTWSGSGPWTKTVSVSGVTASDEHLGLYLAKITDDASRKLQAEAFNCITWCETQSGGILLTCRDKKPTVAISTILKGER